MPKFLYILMLMGMWALNSYAQNPDIKRTWHWYFGAGAGLDFSSGTAVADTTGKLHSYESCAVMSDTAGNLLFYTDGDTIWDNNHNIYINGTGLMGCGNNNNSSAQGALIVPHPGKDSLYYIFTSDCFENLGANGYRYTLVDVKNKQILQKNILLYAPSTEGMAATKHANGVDYWLVTHEYNSNKFVVYKIDDTLGIIMNNPIVSSFNSYLNTDFTSFICFSHNGEKIGALLSTNNIRYTLILNFDKYNGTLSNPVNLGNLIGFPIGYYAIEFSPDDTKLYCTVSSSNDLFQYDISVHDSIAISNSWQWINNSQDSLEQYGQLKCSVNDKIIIATLFSNKISYINQPNNSGTNCDIISKGINLSGKVCELGLPNFLSSYYQNTIENNSPIIINEIKRDIIIPNIFTPNNDGVNDLFTINIEGYKAIRWRIYNRWGSELKSGELNIENKPCVELWDGRTSAGEKVSDGVYYYILNLTNTKNETETKKGYIQLLR